MSEWDDIRAHLGDKIVDALTTAVTSARDDLHEYRAVLPHLAYEQSNGGLAGWIHDRMWQHLQRALFDVPGTALHEQGSTRELVVGMDFRLRLKRHNPAGLIRNYPTTTALAFWEVEQVALPGLEETRLCFGYVWDAETGEIGDPVASRRCGQDKVLWMVRLDEGAQGNAGSPDVEPIVPPTTPTLPRIDLPQGDDETGTERPT